MSSKRPASPEAPHATRQDQENLGEPGWRLDYLRTAAQVAGLPVKDVILPREDDVVLDGIRIHYLDWGSSGKPPIVFVHGGGLTAHTWDMVCLALRQQFRCLAVDLRGHGDSEWSQGMEYGLDAHCHDLEQFVARLGISRFVLVGMSLGGLISIVYAARNSARLSAMVLVDVGPSVRPEGADRIRQFLAQSDEFASIDDVVERALAFNPARDATLLRLSLLHNLRALPNGTMTWKYDRRHRLRQDFAPPDPTREQLWSLLPKVNCPVLVLCGDRSDVFTDDDARQVAETLPDGRWSRVSDAGHTIQGDNPRGFIQAIEPFLTSSLDVENG